MSRSRNNSPSRKEAIENVRELVNSLSPIHHGIMNIGESADPHEVVIIRDSLVDNDVIERIRKYLIENGFKLRLYESQYRRPF